MFCIHHFLRLTYMVSYFSLIIHFNTVTQTNGQKGTNIMNMVISFYNNGMDGTYSKNNCLPTYTNNMLRITSHLSNNPPTSEKYSVLDTYPAQNLLDMFYCCWSDSSLFQDTPSLNNQPINKCRTTN